MNGVLSFMVIFRRIKILVFDIETLGTYSDSVIASAGIVFVDATRKQSYDDLIREGLFVKFNIEHQIKNLHRKVDKDTIEWWNKQHKSIRDYSMKPSPDDLLPEQGIKLLQDYCSKHKSKTIWTRGSLDQMAIDHLARQVDMELIMPYNAYRDCRTAIDIFTGSTNGYCKVNYPGFESYNVIKHNPCHDAAYDAMMLTYGV